MYRWYSQLPPLTSHIDRLRQQIEDVQRHLCGDSSENAQPNDQQTAHAASDSTTLDRIKRRNSIVGRPGPISDPPRAVHRSKTLTTYSTKKPTSSTAERDHFIARFGEDAIAPESSRSIRYSDHSGTRSSNGLPTGSMQNEFINHEPAMFKESGSTIPDNESSHERMVEQALRSKPLKGVSSPEIKLFDSNEMPKSSSFPWSPSEQTESARSNRFGDMNGQKVSAGDEAGIGSQTAVNQGEIAHEQNDTVPAGVPHQEQALEESNPCHEVGSVHRSSPTVEVNVVEAEGPAFAEPDAVPASTTQKAGRGRKRKVQNESSEPLNSEDIAVGLPKERYKPRPSKRRATHNLDEAIDYSVVVEKAAKKKRSRTTGGSFTSVEDPLQGPTTQRSSKPEDDQEIITVKAVAAHGVPAAERKPETTQTLQQDADPPKPSPIVEVPATKAEQTQVPSKATGQASQNAMADDTTFAKPAGKLKKPISKSKRSSTTIFEDHVDFTGKQRSPSLSQQQAMRQTALRDVKNEVSPAQARRGRKTMIADEDDEDELALDSEHNSEQPEGPPKKRGRGRPRKDTPKIETQTEDSTLLNIEPEIKDETTEPTTEPPTKRRRGRPPKSAPPAPAPNKNTNDTAETSNPHPEPQQEEADTSTKPSPDPPTTDNSPKPPTIPTPSPEKQLPAPATKNTPAPPSPTKPAKPSPPTHSPIKRASPAPYRVGLSRKRQIPSLLKTVNPRPPRNG